MLFLICTGAYVDSSSALRASRDAVTASSKVLEFGSCSWCGERQWVGKDGMNIYAVLWTGIVDNGYNVDISGSDDIWAAALRIMLWNSL
jgi:hypothetical protein